MRSSALERESLRSAFMGAIVAPSWLRAKNFIVKNLAAAKTLAAKRRFEGCSVNIKKTCKRYAKPIDGTGQRRHNTAL